MNLPKLKTHKKTGVTLALKNLVGINGDKNLLPHHCVGSAEEGGDEFPGTVLVGPRAQRRDRGRRAPAQAGRRHAASCARRGASRTAARGDAFIRSGNWHGNRTTWRMCLDLNRCLYYSDAQGPALRRAGARAPRAHDARRHRRGRGRGPARAARRARSASCSPRPIRSRSISPRCADGLRRARLPKIREAMRDADAAHHGVRSPADVDGLRGRPEHASSEHAPRARRSCGAIDAVRARTRAGAATSSGASA